MRGHHEGSVTYRKDRERWLVRVSTPSGARVSRLAKTEKEAWKILSKLQATQRLPAPRITLATWLNQWLAGMDVRPATYKQHESIVRVHLIPALGHIPLEDLTPQHVQRYLAGKKLHPRTVTHHLATLRRALVIAQRQELVTRNVAQLVEPPRVPFREVRALDADQVRRLLDGTRDDPLWPLYVLATTTGMRQAELLGLAWDDVHLDAGTLTVRNTLHRVRGQWALAEPKTARGRRTIALAPMAVEALRGRPRAEGPYYGLVFTTPKGMPLNGPNLLPAFYAHLDRLGLPRVSFHGLRHSTASVLLAAGVPARVVMELLGHSTIAVTMNTYSHVTPALTREAADKMQEAING